MHDEGADQEGGGDVAGDAEREQRDQVGADHGAVRRLGRGDAFQLALAEFLRLLRGPLGGGVADQRGDAGADARNRPDGRADQRGAGERALAGGIFGERDAPVRRIAARVERKGGFVGAPRLFHADQDFAHHQHAHAYGDDRDAVLKL